MIAVERVLGELAVVRTLGRTDQKPLFCKRGCAPSYEDTEAHWGSFAQMSSVTAHRARVRGMKWRPAHRKPEVRLPGHRINGVVPAVVMYRGTGVYRLGKSRDDPRDLCVAANNLPLRAHTPGQTRPREPSGWDGTFPPHLVPDDEEPLGWWPVCIVEFDGWVYGEEVLEYEWGCLVLCWVCCLYQWEEEIPTLWRVWVYVPRG